jgi:hypothetical protein
MEQAGLTTAHRRPQFLPVLSKVERFTATMPTVWKDKALAYERVRDGSVKFLKLSTKKRVADATERAGTKTRKKSRWRGEKEERKEGGEDKQRYCRTYYM